MAERKERTHLEGVGCGKCVWVWKNVQAVVTNYSARPGSGNIRVFFCIGIAAVAVQMRRSVSAQDLPKKTLPMQLRRARVSASSNNSLATEAYQIASVTGSQLDNVACIVSSLSQPRSTPFDALSFPADVLDDLKACLSTPPQPSSVVHLEQKEIPMRHLEIMMRRRRRRNLKSLDEPSL